jgi:hydroxyacylglutathione hydrolase
MRVVPVPCLSDNYAYLVHRDGSKKAVVVDPSEHEPVLAALEREGLELCAILNTHHHWDHIGGNEGLIAKLGELPVYAHESDSGRVPAQTVKVKEGEKFEVVGLEVMPLHVPGHTTGAVAYHTEGAVFTGDTLFVAGCGRLFEGTPAMMNESLNDKLASLPDETLVYCGHEYTVSNLKFAQHVEPDNSDVSASLEAATKKRERGEPTVPSTIGAERKINPFLRVAVAGVQARYGSAGDVVATLAAVRKDKDNFRA